MTETETIQGGTEALSLQARLERLEAAIVEGHAILSRVSAGRDAVEKAPVAEGATACAVRCQVDMHELNQRLTGVAELIGAL